MFSDNFRFLKVIFIFMILAGLVAFAEIEGPKKMPGVREFKVNPFSMVNKEIEFNGKIKKIGTDSFFIEQKVDGERLSLEISGDIVNAKIEDTIYAVATYKSDKTLHLERYIISNSRPIKIAISFIAFLWVLLIFLKNYNFDFRKLILIERD